MSRRRYSEIRTTMARKEARVLRKLADKSDRDANTLDGIGRVNALKLNIARSLNTALNYIENGDNHEVAFAAASRIHGVPIPTIAQHYDANVKMQRAAERAQRDREINRLARTGLTNEELASRFDLSEGHVSRIISDARRHK